MPALPYLKALVDALKDGAGYVPDLDLFALPYGQ